jgi:hypothetical protein
MSSAITTLIATRPGLDSALIRHLQKCRRARGRWFGAAMLAEELHRLVAPRFAATLAPLVVVTAACCTWL